MKKFFFLGQQLSASFPNGPRSFGPGPYTERPKPGIQKENQSYPAHTKLESFRSSSASFRNFGREEAKDVGNGKEEKRESKPEGERKSFLEKRGFYGGGTRRRRMAPPLARKISSHGFGGKRYVFSTLPGFFTDSIRIKSKKIFQEVRKERKRGTTKQK